MSINNDSIIMRVEKETGEIVRTLQTDLTNELYAILNESQNSDVLENLRIVCEEAKNTAESCRISVERVQRAMINREDCDELMERFDDLSRKLQDSADSICKKVDQQNTAEEISNEIRSAAESLSQMVSDHTAKLKELVECLPNKLSDQFSEIREVCALSDRKLEETGRNIEKIFEQIERIAARQREAESHIADRIRENEKKIQQANQISEKILQLVSVISENVEKHMDKRFLGVEEQLNKNEALLGSGNETLRAAIDERSSSDAAMKEQSLAIARAIDSLASEQRTDREEYNAVNQLILQQLESMREEIDYLRQPFYKRWFNKKK